MQMASGLQKFKYVTRKTAAEKDMSEDGAEQTEQSDNMADMKAELQMVLN